MRARRSAALEQLGEGVDVALFGAVVDDRRADRRDPVEDRQRRRRLAALMQLHDDFARERTVLIVLDAEADDVERHRRAQREGVRLRDPRLEPLRHAAGLLDALAQTLGAEGFDGEPGL